MIIRLSKQLRLLLLLLLYCMTAFTQYKADDFTLYTTQHGLNENNINCIYQDKDGYIWVGSDAGLNRFDGNSFIAYKPADHLRSPGGFTHVRKIKKINDSTAAVISYQGLYLLNTSNLSLKALRVPGNTPIAALRNNAWEALPLPGEHIALASSAGFYVFNKEGNIRTSYHAYKDEDIGERRIFFGKDLFKITGDEYYLYHDENGLAKYDFKNNRFRANLDKNNVIPALLPPVVKEGSGWLSRNQVSDHEFVMIYFAKDSLLYYNSRSGKATHSALPFPTIPSFSWQTHLTSLDDSTFLVNGGNSGFYILKLHRPGGQLELLPHRYLENYKINFIFVDKEKRIWAATTSGLLKQNLFSAPVKTFHLPTEPADLSGYGYVCSYRYKDKLYLGRYSWTTGLIIVDTATMKVEKQLQFYGPGGANEIKAIQSYHKDTLWISSSNGLSWFDVNTHHYGFVKDAGLAHPISSMQSLSDPTPDSVAWLVGNLNGLLGRYHIPSRTFTWYHKGSNPAIPFEKTKNSVVDSYGDLWLSGHSLARFKVKENIFDTVIKVYAGNEKFNEDIITISADNQGSLWLHNIFNGLLEYKIREKKFIAYGTGYGLPYNAINSMSPVIDNQLWFASVNRLVRFNVLDKNFEIFDQADGLSQNKAWGKKIFYDSATGFFYLTCGDDLVRFSNYKIPTSGFSAAIKLQELSIIGKKTLYHPQDHLELPTDQNHLGFQFGIVDFENSSDYRFYYKLSEEAVWESLGTQRNIVFTALSPGHYQLFFKATHPSGESKILLYHFEILPPFWKTSWFIGTVIGILLFAGYLLYRRRISSVRQKGNLDKQLAQTEMKALHAQMNPHFVFNSLNSIREMILHNENSDASHYLNKFAQLIRIVLDNSSHTFISLKRTIEHLELYVEMEKIRTANFNFHLLADKNLDQEEVLLPPMLIQPFIENSIWHGASKEKPVMITVSFSQQAEQLVCEISDDGIGIAQSVKNKPPGYVHRSVGIANVENRIRLLNEKYDIKCSLVIKDRKEINIHEHGTLVVLTMPVEIKE